MPSVQGNVSEHRESFDPVASPLQASNRPSQKITSESLVPPEQRASSKMVYGNACHPPPARSASEKHCPGMIHLPLIASCTNELSHIPCIRYMRLALSQYLPDLTSTKSFVPPAYKGAMTPQHHCGVFTEASSPVLHPHEGIQAEGDVMLITPGGLPGKAQTIGELTRLAATLQPTSLASHLHSKADSEAAHLFRRALH